jgi:hypothetical protein
MSKLVLISYYDLKSWSPFTTSEILTELVNRGLDRPTEEDVSSFIESCPPWDGSRKDKEPVVFLHEPKMVDGKPVVTVVYWSFDGKDIKKSFSHYDKNKWTLDCRFAVRQQS